MKTTKRFERAVSKLYNAFHNGTLDAGDCKHCAVGNILGHDKWTCSSPSSYLWENSNPKDEVFSFFDGSENNSEYSSEELKMIEYWFIIGHEEYELDDKNCQFKGLCAVIEYLCELDNIPNIMDYTSLFETENNKPIKELTF